MSVYGYLAECIVTNVQMIFRVVESHSPWFVHIELEGFCVRAVDIVCENRAVLVVTYVGRFGLLRYAYASNVSAVYVANGLGFGELAKILNLKAKLKKN
jgi:hypothetical protein